MIDVKKNKGGRPVYGKPKDERMSLRLSAEDKEKIYNRAKELGYKNISEYVVYACISDIELSKI